jgi:hypothetical protein
MWVMPLQRSHDLRLFVGGVGVDATESQIRTAFSEMGIELKHVAIIVNPATGFNRGFAFVYVAASHPSITPNDVLDRMRGATVNGHPSTLSLIPERPMAPPSTTPATPRP